MEMQQAQIKTYQKGDIVFQQGDSEKLLYKVLLGEVHIYLDYGKPSEINLAIMKKDQCFGEMSILEDCPRSATAVAMMDVSLIVYPEQLMGSLLHQNPSFAAELTQTLSKRLRKSNDELEKMYSMLLALTEQTNAEHDNNQKNNNREIIDYIRKHTIYTPEGAPKFNMKV